MPNSPIHYYFPLRLETLMMSHIQHENWCHIQRNVNWQRYYENSWAWFWPSLHQGKQATPQKSLPVKLKQVKIKAFYVIRGILDISWHAEKESHHFRLSWEWIIHVKENVYSDSFGITEKHSLTCKDHWCSLP